MTMIELIVKGYYHLLLVVVSLAIFGFWLVVVAVWKQRFDLSRDWSLRFTTLSTRLVPGWRELILPPQFPLPLLLSYHFFSSSSSFFYSSNPLLTTIATASKITAECFKFLRSQISLPSPSFHYFSNLNILHCALCLGRSRVSLTLRYDIEKGQRAV